MEPIPQLGQHIQQLRERKRLSVQELADKSGTTYQSIWRIEHGKQKDPSVALMRGIARALGVGVDYLIEMFSKDIKNEETESSERMGAETALV